MGKEPSKTELRTVRKALSWSKGRVLKLLEKQGGNGFMQFCRRHGKSLREYTTGPITTEFVQALEDQHEKSNSAQPTRPSITPEAKARAERIRAMTGTMFCNESMGKGINSNAGK